MHWRNTGSWAALSESASRSYENDSQHDLRFHLQPHLDHNSAGARHDSEPRPAGSATTTAAAFPFRHAPFPSRLSNSDGIGIRIEGV